MARLVVLVMLLSLAGCVEPEPEPAADLPLPDRLPEDWDSGVPMLPYQRGGTHSGAKQADLYPTSDLARPAACAAFRDEVRHARDSCTLRDAEPRWENRSSWVAEPAWAGCEGGGWGGCPGDTYPDPYRPHVVAFDAAGRPVAWWNGTDAPDTQYWTE
jgi:hypothetical protein